MSSAAAVDLAAIDRHIQRIRKLIADQRAGIEQLRNQGVEIDAAKQVLGAYQASLRIFERERAAILRGK